VRRAFPAPAHRIEVAATGAEGLARIQAGPPDVVLLDLRLPDQSGPDVYQQIRGLDARIPVIFVTVAKGADPAIEAMKQGAYDYLCKPLDPKQLRRVVGEALEVARRMREPAVVAESAPDPDVDGAIVGSCPAMREVYKAVGRVAAQDVSVLITGESGTGKELVARALYQHGLRAKAPFLALNCAAIPEQLPESELFGHEKSAFTGADRRRIGKFEQCHGGTLFLDEVGDMPLALQAKVLRLPQEQTFERVGGNETIRTDVRLIAATHRDLEAWSEEGKFRPDLYYRLNVFAIHLPPLRERGDDLAVLVRHFVRRFSRELGQEVQEVAPEALARLRGYSWPGTVRELQSVLKRALPRAHGPVLLPDFLSELREAPRAPAPPGRLRPGGVPPRAARPRLPRPVRGGPPGAGPAAAAPRPGAHRREPGPGRPPAGHRPPDPAHEAPGPGTARRALRRSRRRPAVGPGGRRSFGLAHASEQRVHVGPEPLPLLAFLVRQPGEGVLAADAGQVAFDLPAPHPPPHLGFRLRGALVERLAPPGQVLAEPFEGLAAPEGALLVAQRVRVLALATTGSRGGAGGVVTSARRDVLGKLGLRAESVAVEASCRGVILLQHAQFGEIKLLGGVGRFVHSP
jgi:two-component system nitrogen regulation response regulator GlnG